MLRRLCPFYDGIVLPDAFGKAAPKEVKADDKLRAQIKRMLAKLDRCAEPAAACAWRLLLLPNADASHQREQGRYPGPA